MVRKKRTIMRKSLSSPAQEEKLEEMMGVAGTSVDVEKVKVASASNASSVPRRRGRQQQQDEVNQAHRATGGSPVQNLSRSDEEFQAIEAKFLHQRVAKEFHSEVTPGSQETVFYGTVIGVTPANETTYGKDTFHIRYDDDDEEDIDLDEVKDCILLFNFEEAEKKKKKKKKRKPSAKEKAPRPAPSSKTRAKKPSTTNESHSKNSNNKGVETKDSGDVRKKASNALRRSKGKQNFEVTAESDVVNAAQQQQQEEKEEIIDNDNGNNSNNGEEEKERKDGNKGCEINDALVVNNGSVTTPSFFRESEAAIVEQQQEEDEEIAENGKEEEETKDESKDNKDNAVLVVENVGVTTPPFVIDPRSSSEDDFDPRSPKADNTTPRMPLPRATRSADVEPQKTLREFIEDFKQRLKELQKGSPYPHDFRELYSFLQYLDTCLKMSFVDDILGDEDLGVINQNGNLRTREDIVFLWNLLPAETFCVTWPRAANDSYSSGSDSPNTSNDNNSTSTHEPAGGDEGQSKSSTGNGLNQQGQSHVRREYSSNSDGQSEGTKGGENCSLITPQKVHYSSRDFVKEMYEDYDVSDKDGKEDHSVGVFDLGRSTSKLENPGVCAHRKDSLLQRTLDKVGMATSVSFGGTAGSLLAPQRTGDTDDGVHGCSRISLDNIGNRSQMKLNDVKEVDSLMKRHKVYDEKAPQGGVKKSRKRKTLDEAQAPTTASLSLNQASEPARQTKTKKKRKGGLTLVYDPEDGEGTDEMTMEERRALLPRYQKLLQMGPLRKDCLATRLRRKRVEMATPAASIMAVKARTKASKPKVAKQYIGESSPSPPSATTTPGSNAITHIAAFTAAPMTRPPDPLPVMCPLPVMATTAAARQPELNIVQDTIQQIVGGRPPSGAKIFGTRVQPNTCFIDV